MLEVEVVELVLAGMDSDEFSAAAAVLDLSVLVLVMGLSGRHRRNIRSCAGVYPQWQMRQRAVRKVSSVRR